MYEEAPITPAHSRRAPAGRVHDARATADPLNGRLAASPKDGRNSRQFDHAIYIAGEIPDTSEEGRGRSPLAGGDLQTSCVQEKIFDGICQRGRPAEYRVCGT